MADSKQALVQKLMGSEISHKERVRLVALANAAQELLAACKLVLSEHERKPFYESHSNADRALAACEAAIAKATGREGS